MRCDAVAGRRLRESGDPKRGTTRERECRSETCQSPKRTKNEDDHRSQDEPPPRGRHMPSKGRGQPVRPNGRKAAVSSALAGSSRSDDFEARCQSDPWGSKNAIPRGGIEPPPAGLQPAALPSELSRESAPTTIGRSWSLTEPRQLGEAPCHWLFLSMGLAPFRDRRAATKLVRATWGSGEPSTGDRSRTCVSRIMSPVPRLSATPACRWTSPESNRDLRCVRTTLCL